MKIFNLAMCSLIFNIHLSAQVRINVTSGQEKPSAMLQLDASDKGASFPNVALSSTTDNIIISSPKDGLLVYNINTISDVLPGYYYRYNGTWHPIGRIVNSYIFQQKIDQAVLGYTPSNTGIIADASPGTISVGGVNYAKMGCKKWEENTGGNGHTYCGYSRTSGGNWATAFDFAKNRGGYLATITSDAERNWIQTNVIDTFGLSSNIWIGYNKYLSRYIPLDGNNNDAPFASHRYKWITGEKWAVNWENSTGAIVQSNFAAGEPNIVNANGCTYISSGGGRLWNDMACTSTTNTNHLIVEFQDIY